MCYIIPYFLAGWTLFYPLSLSLGVHRPSFRFQQAQHPKHRSPTHWWHFNGMCYETIFRHDHRDSNNTFKWQMKLDSGYLYEMLRHQSLHTISKNMQYNPLVPCKHGKEKWIIFMFFHRIVSHNYMLSCSYIIICSVMFYIIKFSGCKLF